MIAPPKQLRMRAFCGVLTFFAILATGSSFAGTRDDNCGATHRPGDHFTCYVNFQSNTDLTGIELVFNLPREDKPRHQGPRSYFAIRPIARSTSPGKS